MARSFRGASVHKVDAKGRVSIPAQFRRVLEEGDPDHAPGQNPNLVIIYGRPGRACLECFTIRAMEEIDDVIAALPRFSRDREKIERLLNTRSTYAQLDETGRIVLSQQLREMIGVQQEAMFAGMGHKFQIWEPEAFAVDDAIMTAEGAEKSPEGAERSDEGDSMTDLQRILVKIGLE